MSKILVSVLDNTGYIPAIPVEDISMPDYNILIMGQYDKGPTNQLLHFKPTEASKFVRNVGLPNYKKYGIGPEVALAAMNAGMGVYSINLRPADAKMANVILVVKYKVNASVPKVNEDGDPLYLTPEGAEVTEATGNTAIVRDVLELVFETMTSSAVDSHAALATAMDAAFSDVVDGDGYKTIPLFGLRYAGATAYGNKLHFRLVPVTGTDKKTYYRMELYDGETTVEIPEVVSIFPEAFLSGQSAYIENVINKYDLNLKCVSSSHVDKFFDLLEAHVQGKDCAPTTFDLFAADHYDIVVAGTTMAASLTGAFQFANGTDGTGNSLDTGIQSFLNGTLVPDINSIIRYKISLIPDIGYSDIVKGYINTFVNARNYTTVATMEIGVGTIAASETARSTTFAGNYPHVRFISGAQGAYRYDEFNRRNFKFPACYYDAMSMFDHLNAYGGLQQPFAGPTARWKDFEEDTMIYPKEDRAYLDSLESARINIVKKDRQSGAFLATQLMGTVESSDLTEFNNCMILGRAIYALVDLAHSRSYQFNTSQDTVEFNKLLKSEVLPDFSDDLDGISVVVYKKGATGEDKNTNVIKVLVNFKDIIKATEVQITVTDQEISGATA